MARKLIWSTLAHDDLRNIVRFIARDNPERAASFGLELIRRAEILGNFPEMGRIVPEKRDPLVREMIIGPYRLVYRVNDESQSIEFIRVWHSARGHPEGIE